jgi:hypothetical protein
MTKWGMQAEKHGISGAFGLDNAPDNQTSQRATRNPLRRSQEATPKKQLARSALIPNVVGAVLLFARSLQWRIRV